VKAKTLPWPTAETCLRRVAYNLNYANAGDYAISLTVDDSGCQSDVNQLNVIVEAPFTTPIISCRNSSFTSVEFNWDTEVGINSFMVSVNGGTPFVQDSTTFFQGGLNEGETISIEVVALGTGSCGNSPVGIGSCETDSCPTITVTPPANETFCLGRSDGGWRIRGVYLQWFGRDRKCRKLLF